MNFLKHASFAQGYPKFYVGELWEWDIHIWIFYKALQNPSSTSQADLTPAVFFRQLPRLCLFSGNDLSRSHSPPVCFHILFVPAACK